MASKISVIIDVVADKASTSLRNFRSDLDNTEGSFGKMKVAGSAAFDQIKGHAAELAVAAGTALVAFGVKAVGAFQDLALEAGKFSDVTGIAVEDASRWIEVAGDIGVSSDAVQSSFQKMNKAIADGKLNEFTADIVRAKDGTVDANATFQNLVTKIGAIQDPTERAAAAQKAFGKGYAEIAEVMEMSAGELQRALKGVSDSKIIDEGEVDKAKKFRAAMDELKDKTEDLALTVGESLVPVLTDLAEVAGEVSDVLGAELPGDIKVMDAIMEPIAGKFRAASDNIQDMKGSLYDLDPVVQGVTQRLKADAAAAEDAEAASEALGDETDRTAKSYERLTTAVEIMKGALSNLDAENAAIQAQRELQWVQAEAAAGSVEAQGRVEAATRESIDATIAYIDTLGGIPTSKATAIAALIDEGSLDAVEQQLRILARNRVVDVQIVARGGAGYGPPGPRASGGPVSAGMPYIVGEQGPELMVPSSNGNIIPNSRIGGASGVGGNTNNITINMPPGSNGQDVVNAIKKYERTAGPGWRS